MELSAGTREMAKLLGLKLNKYKFIETAGGALDTVSTTVDGVFSRKDGSTTGPAGLEDSISSAGLAAMKAIATVRRGIKA